MPAPCSGTKNEGTGDRERFLRSPSWRTRVTSVKNPLGRIRAWTRPMVLAPLLAAGSTFLHPPLCALEVEKGSLVAEGSL